jgi:alpha-mannosidase
VQLLQVLPLAGPAAVDSNQSLRQADVSAEGCGCGLRLVETEGRPVRARLRCFRSPKAARQRDFTGQTIYELAIDGDAVLVDLTSFEIADIEIRFD